MLWLCLFEDLAVLCSSVRPWYLPQFWRNFLNALDGRCIQNRWNEIDSLFFSTIGILTVNLLHNMSNYFSLAWPANGTFGVMGNFCVLAETIPYTRPLTELNIDDIAEITLLPIDFLHRDLAFSLQEGEPARGDKDSSYDPNLYRQKKTSDRKIASITFSKKK